jgi:hypothetical protein
MTLKLTGSPQAVIPDRPQAKFNDENRPIGSRAVLKGRPVVWAGPDWRWQSAKSFQRLQSSGRLNRSPFADPIGAIRNEVKWLTRGVRDTNRRNPQGFGKRASQAVVGAIPGLNVLNVLPTVAGQTGRNLNAALTVGAMENAAKLGIAVAQKVRGRQANPESSRAGSVVEQISAAGYRLLGATPPGQQNEFERGLDAVGRSTGTAIAGTAVAAKAIPAVGVGLTGAVATGGLRLAAGEALSTLADDNRGGNLVNVGEAATGRDLPLAVDVGQDDWIVSGLKSIVPNAVPGLLLSGIGEGLSGFRGTRRYLSSRRKVAEVTDARAKLEQAGITETDPATGATSWRAAEADAQAQIDQWVSRGQEPAGPAPDPWATPAAQGTEAMPAGPIAPAAGREVEPDPWTATPARGPEAEPAAPAAAADEVGGELETEGIEIDPADMVYDPDLPEADVVFNLVRELDDEQLQALAAQPGPVVPQLDQMLAARDAMPIRPELQQGRVMAPGGSIADRLGPDGQPLAYEQTLEAMPMETLRSVAAPENSPELAQLISDTTGREFEEFTKADIIEGLSLYQERTGQSLLVRDWNQGMRGTDEIVADPERFQFKQGTNEQGEQLGNILAGVDRWDTNAEGVIGVWTDPTDGRTFVVDGHNRLARAKQLGIPTVPVRELPAATAQEARAMGALSNIKAGAGTVFDAAKFMRDSGITSPEQLQQMGVPMSSGNAARGLALAQLPDNIFQAAVDGRLSVGKAAAIGGSGLDETQMQAAFKALGDRDMSDAKFAEVVAQVRSAPVVQGEQVDLFGNTDTMLLMDQKADLVVAIRRDLLQDKRFFGTAARGAGRLEQAGNKINVQGNKAIAADTELVLRTFDMLKYAPGPVSDLLNDGARMIAEGAKPKVIADRIRGEVAEAVRRSMDEQGMPTARPEPAQADDGFDLEAEMADSARATQEAEALFAEADEVLDAMRQSSGKLAETARRMLEVSAGIEDIDGAVPTDRIVPGPRALTPEQRQALQLDVIRKAVDEAEVRPPETPIPELPDPPALTPDAVRADLAEGRIEPGSPAAQALADEIRLSAEFAEQDAQVRAIAEEGFKDAIDYELLTFEEKKALGMADGYDLVPPGQELVHGTTGKAAESIMQGGFRPSRVRSGGTLMGDGVYMATDPRYAGAYGDVALGGQLPDDARILDLVAQGKTVSDFAEEIGVGRPADVFEGELYFSDAQQAQVRQWAMDNGYDGIKFDPAFGEVGVGASEVVIYNLDLANRIVGSTAALAPPPIRPEPMKLADSDEPPARPRAKTADQAARKQIQANEQRMADIRRQAQQEGC